MNHRDPTDEEYNNAESMTCDWGDCWEPTAFLGWSEALRAWLPVCAGCAAWSGADTVRAWR